MEVESALVSHPSVTEAAVVGRPDELKGEAIAAFVTVGGGVHADDKLREELKQHVGKEIGAFAKPDDIRFTDALPKTRSGKIMRRLLRDIAAGRESAGDTTTLEDYTVLAKLRAKTKAETRTMALAFYDTRTRRQATFTPLERGKVKIYVCGVTVYDRCHVGHARSIVFFDVVVRYLRWRGFDVRFVRNITDIEDKIIARAAREGVAWNEVAEKYAESMRRDVTALGCLQPDVEPKATDHIAEMLALIEELEQKGLAYAVGEGDVYFSVGDYPGYGALSRRDPDEMLAGARVDIDERKRNPMDFALWKSSKPGEPTWPSPWGPGRPGWHLECSAMSTKYLGQPFDIHGGGEDLIFPHTKTSSRSRAARAPVPRRIRAPLAATRVRAHRQGEDVEVTRQRLRHRGRAREVEAEGLRIAPSRHALPKPARFRRRGHPGVDARPAARLRNHRPRRGSRRRGRRPAG
jgi:hypothetical protein